MYCIRVMTDAHHHRKVGIACKTNIDLNSNYDRARPSSRAEHVQESLYIIVIILYKMVDIGKRQELIKLTFKFRYFIVHLTKYLGFMSN